MKNNPAQSLPGVICNDAHAARFQRLCDAALRERHTQGEAGIGTLQEKRLHAIVKRFLHEDTDYHEVGLEGSRYVSDLRIGKEAFEVQTGAFYPMRQKIDYYLQHTDCSVTVVHPVPLVKWSCSLQKGAGEFSPRRRVGGELPIGILAELYSLLPFLDNPRLRFHLLLLEVQDFRVADGKRRRGKASLYERVPLSLLGEMELYSPEDFRVFLPQDLPQPFTVRQFSQKTKLRGRDAYSAVRVLTALGLLKPTDPIGRAMAFRFA